MENTIKNQAPRKFSCNFIEPGLVNYDDCNAGTALIKKESLDRFCKQFEGKPIVSRQNHKDGVGADQFDDVAVGLIHKVYFNSEDGWYWADGYLWDADAIRQAENGFSVSCAYEVSETKGGGVYNNMKYEQEIINGEPKHIALVPNPRYNGAKILLNSTEGGESMKIKGIFNWLKGKKNEADAETSHIEVDGEKVPLKNLISAYQAAEAEKAKAGKENEEKEISDDSSIEVDGKEVKISDMMNCYRASKKNEKDPEAAAADPKEKENADAEAKAKEEEEKKNAAEAKAKEEEEKKNAAEAKAKEEEEAKNAKDEEGKEEKQNSTAHFKTLKNAADTRMPKSTIGPDTVEDKRSRGKSLYGSVNK